MSLNLPITINHMTAPELHYEQLFGLAARVGGIGLERENDPATPLFNGDPAETVAAKARDHGWRLVGLSRVNPFKDWSDEVRGKVDVLIRTAKAVGAETVSLIPRHPVPVAGLGDPEGGIDYRLWVSLSSTSGSTRLSLTGLIIHKVRAIQNVCAIRIITGQNPDFSMTNAKRALDWPRNAQMHQDHGRKAEECMSIESDDPYHHLHDENYADAFVRGRVGASDLITTSGRNVLSLNGEWNFVIDPYDEGLRQRWYADAPKPVTDWALPRDYDGGDWQKVLVPSCWNVVKPEWYHYEGGAWYERRVHIEKAPGERLVLTIGAAQYEARVFLNGMFVGAHRGGSTPFTLDITDAAINGDNRLMVQVDNYRRGDRVPMHHTDWFNYGGLYRDVGLMRLPEVHIRDFSVALVPGMDGKRISVDIELSAGVDGVAKLEIQGLAGCPGEIAVRNGVGSLEFDASPELWHPDHPRLYDVALAIGEDRVSDRIGFREIAVVGERVLLNGKDIFLSGICVHEDDQMLGKATNEADIRRRFADAKELGCVFMRLAHYPHHELAARIADEVGIMLWEEIPVYWAIDFTNPDTFADAENQLLELIRRDRNRASVIIWGVGNENADTDERLSFMGRLAASARRADKTRLISAACLINRQEMKIEDRLAAHLDIVGLNEYFGWYEPDFDGLRRLLANSNPGKPVIITETGADAVAGLHGDDKTFFTEELQVRVYQTQLELLATASYVRGITPWILYDFRAERRQTTFQRGWNRKGLIAADKITRKKAFEVLAAHYRARRQVD